MITLFRFSCAGQQGEIYRGQVTEAKGPGVFLFGPSPPAHLRKSGQVSHGFEPTIVCSIDSDQVTFPPPASSSTENDPLVDLVDLSLVLDGVPILKNCHLTVCEGESVGVAGPNGAGKSTLLATVATFLSPNTGAGWVLGARLGTAEVLAIRPRIGWSGHLPALYPDLTLGENLAMVARLSGQPAAAGSSALEQVGLGEVQNVRVERCSNGMRRRADLARLLIGSPRLVLLDEPDAGLDQHAAAIIGHLIRSTTRRGGGVLCVSHDATRLSSWVDRVVEIREGRIG